MPKAGDVALELLVTQAARLADRLEQIDRLLSGDASAWLGVKVAGTVLTLDVGPLVQEERQLSEGLRKLIGDLEKQTGGKDDGKPEPDRMDPVLAIVLAHYGKGAKQ